MQVFSNKEAEILAAMGAGMIPCGGDDFELGAADLKDQWLPLSDHLVSRMPAIMRYGLKFLLHLVNYGWPWAFGRTLKPMTKMAETDIAAMFERMEKMPFPIPVNLLLVKILVFTGFYELDEVKDAIGYQTKFANHPAFEGIKE